MHLTGCTWQVFTYVRLTSGVVAYRRVCHGRVLSSHRGMGGIFHNENYTVTVEGVGTGNTKMGFMVEYETLARGTGI